MTPPPALGLLLGIVLVFTPVRGWAQVVASDLPASERPAVLEENGVVVQSLPEPEVPRGVAAAFLSLASVADAATLHYGGFLGLGIGHGLVIGALGSAAFERVELSRGGSDTGLDVGFGLGGVFLELGSHWRGDLEWSSALFLGVGNVGLYDRATRLEFDSENFAVIEPSIGARYRLAGALSVSGHLAYRFTTGPDDLDFLSEKDFRSFGLTLMARVEGGLR